MYTFLKIAWRDLWRNRLRSGLTLAAITFGTALLLFTMAWARGAHQQMIETSIGLFPGHFHVQKAGYQEEKSLMRSMPLSDELVDYLESSPHVAGYSPRLCTDALVQAGGNLSGARICGVDPEKEIETSKLAETFFPEKQKLPRGIKPFRKYKGGFLSVGGSGGAVIGEDLARNLQAEVGDEISIISQDFYGSIAAGNFRVKGIYRVGWPDLDGIFMIVNLSELADLLYIPGHVTEVAVMLKGSGAIPGMEDEIYGLYSKEKGPWRLERLENDNLWLASPLRPNLAEDSYLQLTDQEIMEKAIERIPHLMGYSGRARAELSLDDEKIDVLGIDAVKEDRASGLFSRLAGSADMEAINSGEEWILVSEKTAESRGIETGEEVRLEGRSYLGQEYELRLKAAGIYKSIGSDPEAYVSLGLLQEMQGIGDNVHQLLIRLDRKVDEDRAEALIVSRLNYEFISWEELMPDLVQFVALDNAGAVLWLIILLVVIAFVVLLTILMSVLERAREFGIMKAIGTRPVEVFWIILMESVFLGVVGSFMGTVLGLIPSIYYTYIPVDLSSYAESMMEFGIEPYMFARIEPLMTLYTFAIMMFVVMVMTVFPAVRAARTRPVQVLRLQ